MEKHNEFLNLAVTPRDAHKKLRIRFSADINMM
jgi:hypothetical protein